MTAISKTAHSVLDIAKLMAEARELEDASPGSGCNAERAEALRAAITTVRATSHLDAAIQTKLASDLVSRIRDAAANNADVDHYLDELDRLLWSVFDVADKASAGGVDWLVARGFSERHLSPWASSEGAGQ
ncbi:hypothetical protein [Aureimonas frigidaquae]|uniref:hypothetical protein n=1 Tax=Aureimonas frigidaquae TaxID=424757 RepID=UPI0007833853|nr:hypothetical protein [Aureimonas frigidaquae]